jgi:peptidoglycan-N-acetylglucosamine deacetylase
MEDAGPEINHLGSGMMTTIVTTSWDDGDPADLRIASLLGARGLAGTFYVLPAGYRGRSPLTPEELRSLAQAGFEIGAHSVSHRTLSTLAVGDIEREVRQSKSALQDLLGREVTMFCYPRGRYNRQVMNQVRTAGYQGARTTRMLSIKLDFDPFEMPTSLQVFPHTDGAYLRNIAKAKDPGRMLSYLGQFRGQSSWIDLGKRLFDRVLGEGGIWHLYGHSWEIEELDLWNELEEMLGYVSSRPGVIYATNSEVCKLQESASSQASEGRSS